MPPIAVRTATTALPVHRRDNPPMATVATKPIADHASFDKTERTGTVKNCTYIKAQTDAVAAILKVPRNKETLFMVSVPSHGLGGPTA